jgi:hypothetical protein
MVDFLALAMEATAPMVVGNRVWERLLHTAAEVRIDFPESLPTDTPTRALDRQALIERLAPEAVRQQFDRLAGEWERRTRNMSSIGEIVSHKAYQDIIRMGEPVIPLILDRMSRKQSFWFHALMHIAKPDVDPVTPEMYGDMSVMTQAWLAWGAKRERGN